MVDLSGVTTTVRCALVCVACDLPAGRKVCWVSILYCKVRLLQEKSFVVMLETKAIQDLIEITGQQEHNLYIDTEKFLDGVWVEQEIISDNVFNKIFVNATVVPVRIGRIPYKIQSGFVSFTSNQWQTGSPLFIDCTLFASCTEWI